MAEEPEDHPMRRCSDKTCRDAREEWLRDTLMPRLRIENAVMIGATVTFCAGIFIWLNAASLDKFELRVKDTYVTQELHRQNITEIKSKIEKMENSVLNLKDEILDRLDRNLSEIRARNDRPF